MKHLVYIFLLGVFSLQAAAQDYADLIKSDPTMAAANMKNYHYVKSDKTPSPCGYEPFYISHYGRHGSRYDTSDKYAAPVWKVMRTADSLGILSDAGKAYYADMVRVFEEQDGMYGMLTALGALEHKQIAERMAGSFGKVFRNRKDVFCQSSMSPRCLVSMANFTHSLKENTRNLEFRFAAGDRYQQTIAYRPEAKDAYVTAASKEDSLRLAVMKPMEIIGYFFNDIEKALKIVGNPYVFERLLYLASSVGHLSDTGISLLGHFPHDVLVRNFEMRNPRFYLSYGMSNEMAELQKQTSRRLLKDFIARADAALMKGSTVAADLRFGHDTAILPLVGHIGIEGMDDWASFDEVNSVWNSSVSICMASNLQMIFYRNKRGNILVKMLYNEKETTIPALKTETGPYYSWSVLREYLQSLL